MAEKTDIKNKFELVVMAGARAHQLLRGCTPRIAAARSRPGWPRKEIKEGKVTKQAEARSELD